MTRAPDDPRDEELLAELFDQLLQDILEGRTPDLEAIHPDRPELRERIARTWRLACSVAGRREPSRPVLGGYEIVRELGHGGMGTVYLARHVSLQRDVAIKVLPRSLAMSPEAKRRFLEEARALAQIRHENVVHIHRIVDHAEMLAFEMEFVAGPSLQTLLARLRATARPFALESLATALGAPIDDGARSTVEWFVRLFIRLARALDVVHAHGIVHRDIKPSNVLLRPDGSPTLADFGLALHADLDGARTRFAGTPVYAAPERLRGGDAGLDARADVYSLGVTLYEALSTSPPFDGASTQDVLRRMETGAAPPLRERSPHVPRDLAVVVHKAMDPDPRHRYVSAAAFADDLERLLALQPIEAAPTGPLRRAWRFALRNRRLFAAAAAGALAVAGLVWPMAAHAASAREAVAVAAAERADARRLLLSSEALPHAWATDGPTRRAVRRSDAEDARLQALQAAVASYDRALVASPTDPMLRAERAAVAAAAALAADDAARGADARAALGPLAQRAHDTLAAHRPIALPADAIAAAAPTDRFSAGLLAFLHGDDETLATAWSGLPSPWNNDPFTDACMALAAAAAGAPEHAYPRLFHAARNFPDASALAFGLADAALAGGDVALARQWLAQAPAPTSAAAVATAELLRLDLAAAAGDREEATRGYRKRVAADPTDPRPLLRLAQLALRDGDRDGGRRMLLSAVTRWPQLAAAHRALARLALEERALAGYLARVRFAVTRLEDGAGRNAAELVAILRLGGLDRLAARYATDERSAMAAVAQSVPLDAWLPSSTVRGLEHGAQLAHAAEAALAIASTIDDRANVAWLLAPRCALVRLPGLTMQLPKLAVAACFAAGELGRIETVHRLTADFGVFRQALGARLKPVATPSLVHAPAIGRDVAFANHAFVAPDLDGDTLPELALACPPSGSPSSKGFVQLHSVADGELLRTWRQADANANVMFARSLAPLDDVDGDLCADVVVGLPAGRGGPAAIGAVEAWSGRSGGLLWRAEEPVASFGTAIVRIGDVDGDGLRDVAVGAPPMRLADDARGFVVVLCGRTGKLLRRIDAPIGGCWFGAALAAVGDVDGDGRDDLAIGGNFGAAPGLVAIHDPRTGSRITAVEEADASLYFGGAIAAAGDLDGDGGGDLYVTAMAAARGREPATAPGSVFAISGRSGRSLYELRGDRPGEGFGAAIVPLPNWRADGQPAIAIGTLRGGPHGGGYVRVFDARASQPLQTITGNQAHARFGYSLFDLGDRDGDGQRELGIVALLRNYDAAVYAVSFADAGGR